MCLQEAEKLIALMDESGDGLIQFWEFVQSFKPGVSGESNIQDVINNTLKQNAEK